jgi:Lrp/AsnC family transcriptional regulator for asnA, asnC and gidA
MTKLDDLDKKILNLSQKGKVSAKIARQLDLPESTIYDRIKRLKKHGYIRRFTALIDPEKVGIDTVAFFKIYVELNHVNSVANKLASFDEISEVYAVAGDFKILIKVRVKSLEDLEKFIESTISVLDGVTNYYPIITLRRYKDDPKIKIK